jgi:hypothetical protein
MAFERGTEFTGGVGVKQSGDAASGSQTGVLGPPAVFYYTDPQTIDMADATFTAVTTIGSASQIKSGMLYVDPNSSGASEAFKLPPEADCKGWLLFITNTGGENILVQNDAAGAILTVSNGETGFFICDGTTWKGASSGLDSIAASVAQLDTLATMSADGAISITEGVSFTEAGDTTYTGTVEIPEGAILQSIQIMSTVLWNDGTSAGMIVGDDDDPNGWFETVNLKATDLLVGEVLDISNAENWGGKQGVYLVAATGRKGRTTAGVDSGTYYGAASEVIGVVTTGGQNGSAGRTFMFVTYAVPTVVAATATP